MAVNFAAFAPSIKVHRRPKNPLDKCTIVSVFPRAIIDYKPTAFPQTHRIEAAPADGFSLCVVEGASWFKEMEEDQPLLEIPITSIQVCEAFIRDYVNGLVGYVPNVAMPGLFFVPGQHDAKSILTVKLPDNLDDNGRIASRGQTFQQLLDDAKAKQKNWFANLVKMADVDWARSNGNPLSVSDLSRLAAEYLGMKDKPWMSDIAHLEKSNCPACGFIVNPAFPICSNCKAVVNEARAKELNLKFAS